MMVATINDDNDNDGGGECNDALHDAYAKKNNDSATSAQFSQKYRLLAYNYHHPRSTTCTYLIHT